MKKYLTEILFILGEDRKRLPVLFLIFLVGSILELVGIGLIGPYLSLMTGSEQVHDKLSPLLQNWGVPHDAQSVLVYTGIALLLVFSVKTVINIWVNSRIVTFSQRQQVRLRSNLMKRYQSLPYTEYIRRNSSEYIDMMQRIVSQFSQTVSVNMLRTISDGIVALGLFGLLAWTNSIALLLLVLLLLGFVLGYDALFKRRMLRYGTEARLASAGMVKSIHEGIEGLKEIRTLRCEKYFHDQMYVSSKRFADVHKYSVILTMVPRNLIELMLVCFIVFLVATTILLGMSNDNLLPTLGVFGVAALRLLPAVNIASTSLVQLRYSRDSISRLCNELRTRPEYATPNNSAQESGDRGKLFKFVNLQLDSARFKYPEATNESIRGVSLEIRSGEFVGLIGPSGAGKTTLVDIFLGLLKPQEGRALYNGVPIDKCLSQWRAQVAYLPQQIFLIDNTLRRNVALGVDEADINDQRLRSALIKAQLNDFVARLPQGVDTILGERGVRLSGGQRQRVALARAFYFGKRVLVMDEATSALDHETEKEVVEEIKRLKGQVTIIMIAHRMSTVRNCDRIYRLKDGIVVEAGSAEALLGLSDST